MTTSAWSLSKPRLAFQVLGVAAELVGKVIAGAAGLIEDTWNALIGIIGDVGGGIIGFIKDLVGLIAGFPNPLQQAAIDTRAALEDMETGFKAWGEQGAESAKAVVGAAEEVPGGISGASARWSRPRI